jgi:hypothetical protein
LNYGLFDFFVIFVILSSFYLKSLLFAVFFVILPICQYIPNPSAAACLLCALYRLSNDWVFKSFLNLFYRYYVYLLLYFWLDRTEFESSEFDVLLKLSESIEISLDKFLSKVIFCKIAWLLPTITLRVA